MRVLLTGASGFIGSHLVPELVGSGHQVLGLTAGNAFAGRLRALGVDVTLYGHDIVERVLEIASGLPDLVFDAGPISSVLPDLIRIAGGDARRALTVSHHGPAAEALGVHTSFESGLRYDALAPFAALAGEGRFTVPVARVFPWSPGARRSVSA